VDQFYAATWSLFTLQLTKHSSVVTMSNKPSLSKYRYLDPQALTSDRGDQNFQKQNY